MRAEFATVVWVEQQVLNPLPFSRLPAVLGSGHSWGMHGGEASYHRSSGTPWSLED
ncbi:MAG: hypothetical protein BMS9Abin05_1635 [Rhodothermia bacterium]|nr:MAG: hypothetical protein BMS9Abin05_1635 [Rhodothermia bacterium]